MTSSTVPVPGANWYPDPGDATRERYWDGSDWTDYVRPRSRPSAAALIAHAEPLEKTSNAFSTAAMVFGALAILILPIVFGAMGLITGAIAKAKAEPNATNALVVVGIGMVVGLMLGKLVATGVV
jgi:hypothetical protein